MGECPGDAVEQPNYLFNIEHNMSHMLVHTLTHINMLVDHVFDILTFFHSGFALSFKGLSR